MQQHPLVGASVPPSPKRGSSFGPPRPSLGAFSARESNASENVCRSGIRSYVDVRLAGNVSPIANGGHTSGAPGTAFQSALILESGLEKEILGHGMMGMGWGQAGLLIVADVMGVGVLAVPGALKHFGWTLGLMALVLCYPINLYTGLLLTRLRRLAPAVVTLGDLAAALIGRWAGAVGWTILYIYLQFVCGDYLVVLGTSLQATISSDDDKDLSLAAACAISGLILLIPNQLRTLQNCTLLCVLSSLAMAGVVILCVGYVVSEGCAVPAEHKANDETNIWVYFGAFSSLLFAFAGQSIFLEMMAEMRDPSEFSKALHVAIPGLLVLYTGVGVAAYSACGDNTPSYLLDALPIGSTIKRVVGGLLFLHTLVSYIINQQVLTRGLHLMLDRTHAVILKRSDPGYLRSRAGWFAISTTSLCLAFILATGVSSFEAMVQIIGAAFATPLCFILPIACLLSAPKDFPELKRRTTETVLAGILLVFAIAQTVIGTVAAIRSIIKS